ncbi:MAG: ABC transporter substrate-binding protein [Symploca sp. SIO2G7]|nr:ABC transporter substrate-binding protein [Symploca sp. SIO2G7]
MAIRFLRNCLGLWGLLVAVSACSPTSSAPEPAIETAENRPQKIVALTSISADIVQNLAADTLVGIPGSPLLKDNPRFEGLTAVSSGRAEPDLEKIVALKPDLVIGAEGFHDKALERLTDLEINVLSVNIDGWDSLKNITQVLATQLNVDPTPLVERYDACLAKANDNGPTVIVLVSREPLLSPNKESWAGDFLQKFNIQNMTAELQGQSEIAGYITLSPEKILDMNPERLLFIDFDGSTNKEIAQLKTDPFWSQLSAVQSEQIYSFNYHGLINPGSIASIEQTCDGLG